MVLGPTAEGERGKEGESTTKATTAAAAMEG